MISDSRYTIAGRRFSIGAHLRWIERVHAQPEPDEPDTTRGVVQISDHFDVAELSHIHAWARDVNYRARPYVSWDPTSTPGGLWSPGDPVAMYLGARLERAASEIVGRQVYLSHASSNTYLPGVPLVRHRDLQSDASWIVVWTLWVDGPPPGWPIYIERPGTVDAFDTLPTNRALCFAGHDIWHWRDPFDGARATIIYGRYHEDERVLRITGSERESLIEAGRAEIYGAPPTTIRGGVADEFRRRLDESNPDPAVITIPDFVGAAEIDRLLQAEGEVVIPRVHRDGESDYRPETWDAALTQIVLPSTLRDRLTAAVREYADALTPGCPDRRHLCAPPRANRAIYTAGQGFGWHWDFHPGLDAIRNRRVTAILTLRAADAGGRLECDLGDTPTPPAPPGTLTLFSSRDYQHRITPVTAGERVSLTSWFEADPA